MKRRKVIIIRNAQYYDFGGGERFPVFLAKELDGMDYQTLVISRSPRLLDFANRNNINSIRGWWWSQQRWSGLIVLLLPVYMAWLLILFFWYLAVFTRQHPDIVHIQSKDDFIVATFAAKALGVRVIWTDHADLKHIFMNHAKWYKNPIGKLVYFSANFADAITVVSRSELNLISSNFKKKDKILAKIQIIHNGTKDVSSSYERDIKRKKFTYCSVSRLVSDKGIREMITAFSDCNKKHEDTELVIIGDGPEEKKFEQLINGNKNIILAGYQADPLKYMANSDVYLHASYHEGFSISLVEASMMGLPIVSTDVGGNVEIIEDGKNGLLIPAKNKDALLEAMDELYTNKALRRKLGLNARKIYIERFQFNQIVKKGFINLYEK